MHLEQYGGFEQLRFKWPASPQFQQIGPDFSINVETEDDDDEVCLTPCPFLLLDLVSREDGEAALFTKESSVGAVVHQQKAITVAECYLAPVMEASLLVAVNLWGRH